MTLLTARFGGPFSFRRHRAVAASGDLSDHAVTTRNVTEEAVYTKQALRAFGSPELTPAQKREFDETGMLIVENVLTKAEC